MASIVFVVAARDVEPYIYDCLRSIAGARQSTVATVVVAEDGSKDSTLAEVERFVSDHPDARVTISRTVGAGAAVARNKAVETIKDAPDFIAFVDGDDLISRDAADAVVSKMTTLDAEIGCPVTTAFDDTGRYLYEHDNPALRQTISGGRRASVTSVSDNPELLDLETSMCMRIFNWSFYKRIGLEFPAISLCEDAPPSRRAFLEARRVLLSNDHYYFYRLGRIGQRTSAVADTTMDMVEAVRLSLDEGLARITSSRQGAYMVRRLVSIAFWAVALLPPSLVPQYASVMSSQLRRVPESWWRAARRTKASSQFKRLSLFYISGGSEIDAERMIYDQRVTWQERVKARLKSLRIRGKRK